MGHQVEQPRTSGSKREYREVRRQVLSAGGTIKDVVDELRRRWTFRPREAYRHAYGWSQRETAVRFTEVARRVTGIGSKPMPSASIGQFERWPQEGRQPTPYVLSVLGEVFSTDPDSLVDDSDIEAMPAEDKTVLDALRRVRSSAVRRPCDPQNPLPRP